MTEVYKVGVTFALNNLVSSELARIGREMVSVNQKAERLKLAFGDIAKIGIIGGLTAAVAVLAAGVKEASKFQIEFTKFQSLGFGDAINSQAKQYAEGMKTIGTSTTENMALLSDAMAVFKNLGHAELAAPLMSKMMFANSVLYGEGGGANDKKFMDMLKVIEFRGGLKSDAEFSSQANYVQKVIDGSRNRVDATQLLMALKTGGVSLSQLSNEAFYLNSEPLIQEFGGSRYGTANMSAYQNLIQMRTTQQALTEMMRLGLLDPNKVDFNKFTGKVKRASAGAFIGGDVLTKEGDLAFLEKVLLPAFAKRGITSDDDVINEIGRLFTNRTASSLFSRVYQQRASLHNQQDANKKGMDIDQLTGAASNTLDGKIKDLSAQWRVLMNQMGVLLPVVTKMTEWLTNIIKALQLDSPTAQAVGGFINKIMIGQGADHGETGWQTILGKGSKKSYAPPAGGTAANQNLVVVMDGQKVGQIVTKQQAYAMSGVASMSSSTRTFDGNLSLLPAGH